MKKYDSTKDTLEHIKRVKDFVSEFVGLIFESVKDHDNSKLYGPERDIFDEYTPKLRNSTYGSEEYRNFLKEMKVALDHHYANNRHHPEHFTVNGINDMNLVDIIEMLCDWKAATLRHEDGDILKSLEINVRRFNIDPQFASILKNTIIDLGWIKK